MARVSTARIAAVIPRPGHPLAASLRYISERVASITEQRPSRSWLLLFGFALALLLVLFGSLVHVVRTGIGVWGNDQTVAWAWDIVGFVFWIGIGHAGTLISAVLYIFRQRWRTVVSRAAEAVTLIAVITAAIYPVFHIGRVWLAYWLLPIPNSMRVWPNFKSPLLWDVFAISSYFLVSAMFWYLGLVPDLATARDRASTPRRRSLLRILALGWRGSQRHFKLYDQAYLILAGLATPLVISVHTVVSFDFAVSNVSGWHSTIFPPYFVAGAIFSGSAMVVTLMVFVRRTLHLEDFITVDHFESMNKLVLATGCMLAYAYSIEFFLAAAGNDSTESTVIFGRITGPYAWASLLMLGCNALAPQLYWFKRIRRSIPAMLAISLTVNVGMWLERFVIIVTGQHRSFLPSTWFNYQPSVVDASTFIGSVGLFLTLFLLFVRFVPVLSINEAKQLVVDATHGMGNREHVRPRQADNRERQRRETSLAIVAEFAHAREAAQACRRLAFAGVRAFDAHAPCAVRELESSIPGPSSPLPWISLGSGLIGGVAALGFQYWAEVRDYPMQIGGKPGGSWQALVPVTFEFAILCAAVGCFVGLWILCGLPNRSHFILRDRRFERVSDDQIFVSVERDDPKYSLARGVLREAGAREIVEVNA